jgi:elongation factor 3
MRQLRDGKVENFPSPDHLRCVMVEHSLQGEDGSLSVLDFIAAGKDEVVCFLLEITEMGGA